MQWTDFPPWKASWQPETYMTKQLLESYLRPVVAIEDQYAAAAKFLAGVSKKLKSKSRTEPVMVKWG